MPNGFRFVPRRHMRRSGSVQLAVLRTLPITGIDHYFCHYWYFLFILALSSLHHSLATACIKRRSSSTENCVILSSQFYSIEPFMCSLARFSCLSPLPHNPVSPVLYKSAPPGQLRLIYIQSFGIYFSRRTVVSDIGLEGPCGGDGGGHSDEPVHTLERFHERSVYRRENSCRCSLSLVGACGATF